MEPEWHLEWKRITVGGAEVRYGEAGDGEPFVFLHGFGLREKTYKRALGRLVPLGIRVVAPSLPGFGGTAPLPGDDTTIESYARWVVEFCAAIELDGPVMMAGHSFGGGVAIRTAHDHPQLVRLLVLINSVGGSVWKEAGVGSDEEARHLADRPLWSWGLHAPFDVARRKVVQAALPTILADAGRNLIRHPGAFWRAGRLARTADLRDELVELNARGLPIVVLWGTEDRILPAASLDALVKAMGGEPEVVKGSHAWLLADPDAFGEVMTNVVAYAEHERTRERRRTRWTDRLRARWRKLRG
ncbi:MAG: alpha/beta fold hydrolase [Acidimicrobiia bacterium]|nr:alpha/beta fold hydrolase [Acidimicrobiia bacterium]